MYKIVILLAVVFSCYGCSTTKGAQIKENEAIREFQGEWEVPNWDEFKLTITNGRIVVKQGDIDLWVGTFNTNMPAEGEFVMVSERDPDADLPYIDADTETLEFPFNRGVLMYIDPVLHDGLEFTKVS